MRVCLFDIDGTLISTGGAGKAALEAALCSEFGIPTVSGKLALSGRTDRAIVGDLLRIHDLEESPQAEDRLLGAYLTHLPSSLARMQGCILPGIAALLQELAERDDVVVGLLTGNIREGARLKLEHYGLSDHFAFGGFGDLHMDRDDVAREALQEVHRRYDGQVSPDHVWVIGDTPLDIQCARCIRAKVLAVGTGWHTMDELKEHNPDLLLADLADATPLRQHLNSQAARAT
jgi:phosphoglycolate phosphatase-like HAD superfamily hydrolase